MALSCEWRISGDWEYLKSWVCMDHLESWYRTREHYKYRALGHANITYNEPRERKRTVWEIISLSTQYWMASNKWVEHMSFHKSIYSSLILTREKAEYHIWYYVDREHFLPRVWYYLLRHSNHDNNLAPIPLK